MHILMLVRLLTIMKVAYLGVIAVVAFIAGAFVASPELRAYAAATIRSADIVNETIRSEDIKNFEVKNSDIATDAITTSKINDGAVKSADIDTDAVGASELIGVTKLIFAECTTSGSASLIPPDAVIGDDCTVPVPGAAIGDKVIATENTGFDCFVIHIAWVDSPDHIAFNFFNVCSFPDILDPTEVSIIVYT